MDALVSANNFASLKSARAAIIAADSAVENRRVGQGPSKKSPYTGLRLWDAKVDDYLKSAKTEEDKYTKKRRRPLPSNWTAPATPTRGDVAKAAAKALTRRRNLSTSPQPSATACLAEMQKGGLTDDEKDACKKLFFEKVSRSGLRKDRHRESEEDDRENEK